MDCLLRQHGGPPKWLMQMLRSPLWIPALLSLAQDNPKSFFVAYCLNRIALDHPEAVTQLPPGMVTYRAYAKVLRSYLDSMEQSHELMNGFMNVIVTDDLTITHAAFVCHRMADANLAIKVDERLGNRAFRGLFERIMLRLDDCDDRMIELLTTEKPLTMEVITLMEKKSDGSRFLRHLVRRKIKGELFRQDTPDEVVAEAIQCLSLLGHQTLARPDDAQFLPEAVKLLKKPDWLGDQVKLATVLRALREPFFVDAALPELLKLIRRPELTEFTRLQRSVEALMLCEVAWCHGERCAEIADDMFRNIADVTNESQLRAIYDVLLFLASIGFAVEVIRRLMHAFPPHERRQVNARRAFLLYFLKNANPPYSAEFVTEFIRCITQENFRCLVIDRASGQASRQNAQTVLEFMGKVERCEFLDIDDDTLEKIKDLQTSAKRVTG
jgi:hypothetical protein